MHTNDKYQVYINGYLHDETKEKRRDGGRNGWWRKVSSCGFYDLCCFLKLVVCAKVFAILISVAIYISKILQKNK